MLTYPNCKINLGLRITGKRTDGFHDLETVFIPIPWQDALEIVEAPAVQLHSYGCIIPGKPEDNICVKAWQLLQKDFPGLPPVQIHLYKNIPAGAGLGGGSSNGAAMLLLLNHKFTLNLAPEKLLQYALQLGSDCPFFIVNKPSIARGRGEILAPIEIPFLKGMHLLLINPNIHIPTAWAFGQIKAQPANVPWEQALQQWPDQWDSLGITNDFEPAVCKQWPEVEKVITTLKQAGALYAAMSGTGSTCYGIFTPENTPSADMFPAQYLVKIISL